MYFNYFIMLLNLFFFFFFKQIFEIQEAHDFQKSWFQSPRNVNNFCKLNETWYNRKLWIGDNLNVCNDFISWRQTYYSFLIQHSLNTKTLDLKCVMVKIYIFYLYYNFNNTIYRGLLYMCQGGRYLIK